MHVPGAKQGAAVLIPAAFSPVQITACKQGGWRWIDVVSHFPGRDRAHSGEISHFLLAEGTAHSSVTSRNSFHVVGGVNLPRIYKTRQETCQAIKPLESCFHRFHLTF